MTRSRAIKALRPSRITSLSLAYSPARTLDFTTSAISLGRVMLICCVVRMGFLNLVGLNPTTSRMTNQGWDPPARWGRSPPVIGIAALAESCTTFASSRLAMEGRQLVAPPYSGYPHACGNPPSIPGASQAWAPLNATILLPSTRPGWPRPSPMAGPRPARPCARPWAGRRAQSRHQRGLRTAGRPGPEPGRQDGRGTGGPDAGRAARPAGRASVPGRADLARTWARPRWPAQRHGLGAVRPGRVERGRRARRPLPSRRPDSLWPQHQRRAGAQSHLRIAGLRRAHAESLEARP